MDLLPANDEQRFLIHGLYDLVEQRGPGLEDLARGGPSAIDPRDLPLDVRAALRFAEARRRGARGEELEAARREARELDVLPGPLRRAIEGWPAP